MQTYLHGAQKLAQSHGKSQKAAQVYNQDAGDGKRPASLSPCCHGATAAAAAAPTSPSDAVFAKDDIPQFGVVNDFIHAGYRPPLSYRKCFRSAFAWNNETLNIWTHVLGLAVFVVQLLRFNWVVVPDLQESDSFRHFMSSSSSLASSSSSSSSSFSLSSSLLSSSSSSSASSWSSWLPPSPSELTSSITCVWNLSMICFGLCMGFSAGFHLFSCHSLEVSTWWLGLDFLGMSVATLGCYLSGIFCAFACNPFWRDFYLTLVVGILLLIVFLPFIIKDYWEPEWVWIRAANQIGAVSFGIVPILHAIIIEGGFSSPFASLFVRAVFDLYFFAGLSFFFYASKLPERLLPGRFDCIGQSHQIWHVFIFYTLYNWNNRTLQMLEWRCARPCEDLPPSTTL